MKINFVVPFYSKVPVGGIKIMYEYANRLAQFGHDVVIYHSINTPYSVYPRKRPKFVRQLICKLIYKNKASSNWFDFHESVGLTFIHQISNKFIRDADATITTWWSLVNPLSKLDISKGVKINLIQGYEIWDGNIDLVEESYKYENVKHVVITNYLMEKVLLANPKANVSLIFNAIDEKKFYVSKSIDQRDPFSIAMLYSSKNNVKGSQYGIEGLIEIKKEFPQLKVDIFGVEERPKTLPEWMNYLRQPSNLNKVYNDNAIFLSPSLTEGWALPPAEAMMCGCLFVGTDISGHEAYLHEEHSVIIQPKSVNSIVDSLRNVLTNNDMRIDKAKLGCDFIKRYDWDVALNKFIKILENNDETISDNHTSI